MALNISHMPSSGHTRECIASQQSKNLKDKSGLSVHGTCVKLQQGGSNICQTIHTPMGSNKTWMQREHFSVCGNGNELCLCVWDGLPMTVPLAVLLVGHGVQVRQRDDVAAV